MCVVHLSNAHIECVCSYIYGYEEELVAVQLESVDNLCAGSVHSRHWMCLKFWVMGGRHFSRMIDALSLSKFHSSRVRAAREEKINILVLCMYIYTYRTRPVHSYMYAEYWLECSMLEPWPGPTRRSLILVFFNELYVDVDRFLLIRMHTKARGHYSKIPLRIYCTVLAEGSTSQISDGNINFPRISIRRHYDYSLYCTLHSKWRDKKTRGK